MKTKKILLTSILISLLITYAYSQESPSYRASSHTFKSYTDTYMDVQYFADKPFYKDFGFININANNPNIELGYSHEFKPLVFSTYLSSNFLNNIKSISKDDESISKANLNYSFELLFGFKNKNAIRYGANVYSSIDRLFKRSPDAKKFYINDDNSMVANAHIIWGGTFNSGIVNFKPIAGFSYSYGQQKNYANELDQITSIKGTIDSFKENIGLDIEILPNDKFSHIPGLEIVVDYQKLNYNNAPFAVLNSSVNLSYRMSYLIEEKLRLSLNTGFNYLFSIFRDKSLTDSTSTFLNKTHYLDSNLNLGVYYILKPEVLAFNVGTTLYFPSITISDSASNNSSIKDSEKSTTATVAKLTAGINWNITKNIGMDLAMAIPLLPKFSQSIIGDINLGVSLKR